MWCIYPLARELSGWSAPTRGVKPADEPFCSAVRFNVYYTSLVKRPYSTFLTGLDAAPAEVVDLAGRRFRARILRLDLLVRSFADRARRAVSGILDSPGQHVARGDAPDHRRRPAPAGVEVQCARARQRRERRNQGGQLPSVGRRDAAPAYTQDHA